MWIKGLQRYCFASANSVIRHLIVPKKCKKIILVCTMLTCSLPPAPAPYHPAPAYKPAPYHPAPSYKEDPTVYQYQYAVSDEYAGLNFGADEARDGYSTQGKYSVALPDGRILTVTFNVAVAYSGYIADVTYSGEAKYEPYRPSPAYYKPVPVYYGAPASYRSAPIYHA
nr:cuticle protein 7-like [Lepeophtheirus salmonis]